MRTLVLLALVIAAVAPGPAEAAMMAHYDLAGLVLRSDAIVVADRTAVAGGPSRYHVSRVVRGPVAVGADLVLDDELYEIGAADAEVVVFLSRGRDRPDWFITSSGLRVREGGKLFRFEQWNNPGGFTRVAQGDDPGDQWHDGGAAIDQATFDGELAAAVARADGLTAALAITDAARRRTATLALLAPAGASRPTMGFYADEVAQRAAAGLAAAGDVDGALDARALDRSAVGWYATLAPAPALLAIAGSATATALRRVTALAALRHSGDLFADAPAVRAAIALVDDPSAPVRAAAIEAAASVWQWGGGDKAQAALNRKLAREVGRALAARFAIETDGDVLFALAAAYDGRRLPARRGGPAIAARLSIARDAVHVEVRCLRHAKLRDPALTIDGAALPGWVSVSCGADSFGYGSGEAPRWIRGPHAVALAVSVDRHPLALALGTITADGAGELTLASP